MKTELVPDRVATSLRRKIRRFYQRLNSGDFEWCYAAIDPQIRHTPTSVTRHQYTGSLARFVGRFGRIKVQEIRLLELHVQEKNELYQNRDFAVAEVEWEDKFGQAHRFQERWVRDRRGWWYTRSTGLITPDR